MSYSIRSSHPICNEYGRRADIQHCSDTNTGVGHIGAKRLVDGMGSATDVFRYRTELPDRLPGVNRR